MSVQNMATKLYEVSKVLQHRVAKQKVNHFVLNNFSFLLKWKGYNTPDWTFDSECECECLIQDYFDSHFTFSKRPQTVYGICRVSTKKQAEDPHLSLQAQEGKLMEKYCEWKDQKEYKNKPLRLKTFKLSESVYKKIPYDILQIAENAREGDIVAVHRVDRLSRNVFKFLDVLEQLNEKKVKIYSVEENLFYHLNRLQFVQFVLDANKEAETMGKRVKLILEKRRERGDDVFGRLPYGFSKERKQNGAIKRKIDEQEHKVLKRIRRAYRKDLFTFDEIADFLNVEGVTKRGHPWTRTSVKNEISKFENRQEIGSDDDDDLDDDDEFEDDEGGSVLAPAVEVVAPAVEVVAPQRLRRRNAPEQPEHKDDVIVIQ
jgi:DNA invertase Pin-like site-specific DNA recombinase